jgi:hypothetical protein
MSYPRALPRDGGDPEDDQPVYRQRGRAVPEAEPDESPIVSIVVGGLELGSVDVRALKARAQFDLEDVKGAYDLLTWLQNYAGVAEADLPKIRDELGEMPIGAIIDLAQGISEAIGQALSVPKRKRPTWR